MKVPADYKPKDNNTGATLLTTAKTYSYTPPKPFINITQADYITWCKADLWTIERAILLLLNAETLPRISPSYGICKSTAQQLIYDDFIKIWAITEGSLKAGVLKKIGNDYPSLLSEVLPGDFIQWAKSKGYSLPDELKAIGTATQAEAVGDCGAVASLIPAQNDLQKRTKVLQDWLVTQKEYKPGEVFVLPKGIKHKNIQTTLNNESTDKKLFDLTIDSFTRHFWQEQKIAALKRGR